MAYNSSSDLSFSIIPEATEGTTPTTGAARHEVPVQSGASLPTYSGNDIQSTTMRPNRSSNGSRRGVGSGEGSFSMALQRCEAIDLLLQSVASGTWEEDPDSLPPADVLLGGKTNSSFSTVVKASDNVHFIYGGCVATSFTLEASAAGEEVTANFDFVVMSRTPSATDNAIAVTPTGDTVEFNGTEILGVFIDDTYSLKYSSLTFEINQDANMRQVLGSNVPAGASRSGNREVTFTVTAYREDLAIDALITGEPQNVAFRIQNSSGQYSFTMPKAIGSVPEDVTEDDLMVTITFTAMYDEVSGTNIKIHRFD